MTKRLEGKVAVITGATRGIGYSTAELFVEHGAQVVLAGRTVEAGEALSEKLGENAVFIRTDVTREDDIKAIRTTVCLGDKSAPHRNSPPNNRRPVEPAPYSIRGARFASARTCRHRNTIVRWWIWVGVAGGGRNAKAACKPSSVSGLLGRSDGDHLSRPAVADGLERPTRGWAGLPSPPIRPCSGWGLPSLRCYHRSGELLPRLFTLTRRSRRRAPGLGGVFL